MEDVTGAGLFEGFRLPKDIDGVASFLIEKNFLAHHEVYEFYCKGVADWKYLDCLIAQGFQHPSLAEFEKKIREEYQVGEDEWQYGWDNEHLEDLTSLTHFLLVRLLQGKIEVALGVKEKETIKKTEQVEKTEDVEKTEQVEKPEDVKKTNKVDPDASVEEKDMNEKTEQVEKTEAVKKTNKVDPDASVEEKDTNEKTEQVEKTDDVKKTNKVDPDASVEEKDTNEKTEQVEKTDKVDPDASVEEKDTNEKTKQVEKTEVSKTSLKRKKDDEEAWVVHWAPVAKTGVLEFHQNCLGQGISSKPIKPKIVRNTCLEKLDYMNNPTQWTWHWRKWLSSAKASIGVVWILSHRIFPRLSNQHWKLWTKCGWSIERTIQKKFNGGLRAGRDPQDETYWSTASLKTMLSRPCLDFFKTCFQMTIFEWLSILQVILDPWPRNP